MESSTMKLNYMTLKKNFSILVATGMFTGGVNGAIQLTFEQVGPDVVATISGSFVTPGEILTSNPGGGGGFYGGCPRYR